MFWMPDGAPSPPKKRRKGAYCFVIFFATNFSPHFSRIDYGYAYSLGSLDNNWVTIPLFLSVGVWVAEREIKSFPSGHPQRNKAGPNSSTRLTSQRALESKGQVARLYLTPPSFSERTLHHAWRSVGHVAGSTLLRGRVLALHTTYFEVVIE